MKVYVCIIHNVCIISVCYIACVSARVCVCVYVCYTVCNVVFMCLHCMSVLHRCVVMGDSSHVYAVWKDDSDICLSHTTCQLYMQYHSVYTLGQNDDAKFL